VISPTTKNAELAEFAEFKNFTSNTFHRLKRLVLSSRPAVTRFATTDRMSEKDRLNALTERIISAAIAVHHELGPGMLESAYEACLAYELIDRGLAIERQKALPLIYKGQTLDCGYRVDLIVEASVIVEVKSIEAFNRVHGGQLVSYLRQSGCKVGLLINFNVKWLVRDGIMRKVNGFPE
jgi:GxxExxY protein